ncbi:MAG: hypothetical protein WCP34_00550 [Pseudomonadota bacterium]
MKRKTGGKGLSLPDVIVDATTDESPVISIPKQPEPASHGVETPVLSELGELMSAVAQSAAVTEDRSGRSPSQPGVGPYPQTSPGSLSDTLAAASHSPPASSLSETPAFQPSMALQRLLRNSRTAASMGVVGGLAGFLALALLVFQERMPMATNVSPFNWNPNPHLMSNRITNLALAHLDGLAQQSRPFGEALKLVAQALPSDPELLSLAHQLEPYALGGVLSRENLQEKFGEMVQTWQTEHRIGLLRWFGRRVYSLFVSTTSTTEQSERALYSAQVRIQERDLRGVLDALGMMNGEDVKSFRPWMEGVRNRLAMESILDKLRSRGTKPPSGLGVL